MKIVFIICTTLIILSASCKKSNDQINTPPVTDTIKPPVMNADTSTLLKSEIWYSYDGASIGGSELYQYTYDDHRRITQKTITFGNSHDTTRYTYLNDRSIETFDVYIDGSLTAISNTVYYLGPGNRVDSILSGTTGYGTEAGNNSTNATYFYYNQENQDSLEKHFTNIGAASLLDSTSYFYTGVNLDSAIIRNESEGESGIINYKKVSDYFSKGNLASQTEYLNGVLQHATSFTFTNIPIGGLHNEEAQLIPAELSYYSMPNLISSFGTTLYAYEQDAANRVTTMTISYGGVVGTKMVFTYY
jgi:hypothetical protein